MFEEIGVLYRGLVLGLMISAPVGPIGLLCIRRTIQKGLMVGFATGFGAAFADTIFGAVAALGVAAILDFMRHYDIFIRMLGGALLLFGAYHTWRDKPKPPSDPIELSEPIELSDPSDPRRLRSEPRSRIEPKRRSEPKWGIDPLRSAARLGMDPWRSEPK